MEISVKHYQALSTLVYRLCQHMRWTLYATLKPNSELAKQVLNSLACMFLVNEAKHDGMKISDREIAKIPLIMLWRMFEKTYLKQDFSQSRLEDICKRTQYDITKITDTTRRVIAQLVSEDFSDELFEAQKSDMTEFYDGATKVMTRAEFTANRSLMNVHYDGIIDEIIRKTEDFEGIPGFRRFSDPDYSVYQLLMKISTLRNQNRWATYAGEPEYSVLEHLGHTGLIAMFMHLELHPDDYTGAMFKFTAGDIHDFPEMITTDMPSPSKKLIPGFRDKIDEYEAIVMHEEIYQRIPQYQADFLIKHGMEEPHNAHIKPNLKGADYLAASDECVIKLRGGARDYNFWRAASDFKKDIESGRVVITPHANEFYEKYILAEAERMRPYLMYYDIEKNPQEFAKIEERLNNERERLGLKSIGDVVDYYDNLIRMIGDIAMYKAYFK